MTNEELIRKKKIFQAHRKKLQDFLDFSAATEFGSSCEWLTFLDDFFCLKVKLHILKINNKYSSKKI